MGEIVKLGKSQNESSKPKNIHDGHRKRLFETVQKAGLENLHTIQVLEFVLTYCVPRGDTNPIAHALLEEFGSFHAILEASPEDLARVKGVGEVVAFKLSQFLKIHTIYNKSRISKKFKIQTHDDAYDLFSKILAYATTEELYIIALSPKYEVLNYKLLSRGSLKNVGIAPKQITNFLSASNAFAAIMGHNHPNGLCKASENDIKATEAVQNLCAIMGVKFLDHYILGTDGAYSISNERIIKQI